MKEDESGSKAYAEQDKQHNDTYPGEAADYGPEFKKERQEIRRKILDNDDKFSLKHGLFP